MKRFFLTLLFFSFSQFSTAAQTCTTSQIGPSSNDFDGIFGSDTTVDLIFSSRTIDGHTYYDISANGKYSINSSPEYSSRNLRIRFKS